MLKKPPSLPPSSTTASAAIMPRRSPSVLVCLFLPQMALSAFGGSSVPFLHRQEVQSSLRQQHTVLCGTFDQRPGESNTAYLRRLHDMSHDPATFERHVLQASIREGSDDVTRDHHNHSSNHGDEAPAAPAKKQGAYQRVEDWDAERTSKEELSWEEKVQFDGQRLGNQVRQDSILRKHLNTF